MKLCNSRPAQVALCLAIFLFLCCAGAPKARAAEKTRLRVDDYQIDVELLPQNHKLTARAAVKVTALEDLNVAVFQLNNALRITKLTDANNKALTPERNTQDSTVRFSLLTGLQKNASTTINFEYEGTLESADESPVEGLKLAYVGPDTSYLLYSGLWFPVAGYGVNRFTSTINVTVPAHMLVIGSGKEPSAASTPGVASTSKKAPAALANTKTFSFRWDKPSFPGTIIAGTFKEYKSDDAGLNLHIFFKLRPDNQDLSPEYASTAVKAFTYFVTQYGNAPFNTIEHRRDSG